MTDHHERDEMRPGYQLLGLDQLATLELPARIWLVDGLLPSGSLTLLSGREKGGKSLLVVDLVVCVARGEPFLGHRCLPATVILGPAEEHLRDVGLRLFERLGQVTIGDDRIHVLPINGMALTDVEPDHLRLDQPESLARLRASIEFVRPGVIVLDPLRELHHLDENSAGGMAALLGPIRRLAYETDTAIILVHHLSKIGEARGSTAIRAGVDQEWKLQRIEDEDHLSVRLTIDGRFGPKQTLTVVHGHRHRWVLAGSVVPDDATAYAIPAERGRSGCPRRTAPAAPRGSSSIGPSRPRLQTDWHPEPAPSFWVDRSQCWPNASGNLSSGDCRRESLDSRIELRTWRKTRGENNGSA